MMDMDSLEYGIVNYSWGPMAAMTDRIEVCSMGEFRICQEAQIPVQKLVISGVLKKKKISGRF